MALIVMSVLSALSAGGAASIVSRWPQADPGHRISISVGDELRERLPIRHAVRSKIGAAILSGTAATICFTILIATAIAIGVLIVMIRTNTGVATVDHGVAVWASTRVAGTTFAVVRGISQLGSTPVVIAASVCVAAVSLARRWVTSTFAYLVAVVGGQFAVMNLIKAAVGRVRPDIHQLVQASGSSFPSGHATAAAATYAALALVLSRGRGAKPRTVLSAIAAGIAVAVGCSRVLLGVHWMSDVLGGLILGWSWFAVWSVAFGGRSMRFGAPIQEATSREPSDTGAGADV